MASPGDGLSSPGPTTTLSATDLSDVGSIIVGVQQEVASLRQALASTLPALAAAGSGGSAGGSMGPPGDVGIPSATTAAAASAAARLQALLARAESDLQLKAEVVLNSMLQNDVHVLPTIPAAARGPSNQVLEAVGDTNFFVPSTRPLRATDSRAAAGTKAAITVVPAAGGASSSRPVSLFRSRRRSKGPPPLTRPPAPRPVDSLLNSSSAVAQELLKHRFAAPPVVPVVGAGAGAGAGAAPAAATSDSPRRRPVGGRAAQGRRVASRLAAPAAPLPLRNRVDPFAPPPDISEDDVRRGVLSLVQRGLLPASVDVSPAFQEGVACVTQGAAPLHVREPGAARREVVHAPPGGTFLTNVKLDMSVAAPTQRLRPRPPRKPAGAGVHTSPVAVRPHGASSPTASDALVLTNVDDVDVGGWEGMSPPPETDRPHTRSGFNPSPVAGGGGGVTQPPHHDDSKYSSMMQSYGVHQFIIRHGRVLDSTPEFTAFKEAYRARWGSISHFINCLAKLMVTHSIPTAFVDGSAVADAAADDIDVAVPSVDTMLACVSNVDQVAPAVHRRRRAIGAESDAAMGTAAVVIQSLYRMFACRRYFLKRRRLTQCANVIQTAWLTFSRFRATRRLLRERHTEAVATWQRTMDTFRAAWPKVKTRRRVEVHIPSFSQVYDLRSRTPSHRLRENLQIARLCALRDPLVEVVYVSPFRLDDDLRSYYNKLLAISGGDDFASRFRLVTPENVIRFPPTLPLATVLWYSPRCMSRIRHFTRGKAAYIVPHLAGSDDKRLAMALNLPLLSGDPEVTAPLATCSGSKRVFTAADVNTPPGAHDLYDAEEVVPTLAALVAAQPDYDRWLFKLDHGTGGIGIAYLDVGKIKTVRQLRAERDHHVARDPEYWGRAEVQTEARTRLLPVLAKTLPRRVVMARSDVFESWAEFVALFVRFGGVIEASPRNLVGSPSVNLFIAPDGAVSVLSTQDQLFGFPYVYSGCAFPAQSVPYAALAGAGRAVAEALAGNGVSGFVGIDFVSYMDAHAGVQRMWAVDLNLGMTHSLASFMLFDFLMAGSIDPATGQYYASTPPPAAAPADGAATLMEGKVADDATAAATRFKPKHRRCFTCHEYIFHPSVSMLQLPVFFQLCRAKALAFDVTRRQGTVFLLLDSLSSGALGVMCIDRDAASAVYATNDALTFISDHVGAKPDRREFDPEDSNFRQLLAATRLRAQAMGVEVDKGRTLLSP